LYIAHLGSDLLTVFDVNKQTVIGDVKDLKRVHGVLAVIATFLFGWIAGSHVGFNWNRGAQRVSGVALIVLLAVLALTGLGSYYLTSDAARAVNSVLHEGAGLLAIVPALVHWAVARR